MPSGRPQAAGAAWTPDDRDRAILAGMAAGQTVGAIAQAEGMAIGSVNRRLRMLRAAAGGVTSEVLIAYALSHDWIR